LALAITNVRTRAKFFASPDAEVLNKLFDDLGEGALFPVL
jgi:hypothetical protein